MEQFPRIEKAVKAEATREVDGVKDSVDTMIERRLEEVRAMVPPNQEDLHEIVDNAIKAERLYFQERMNLLEQRIAVDHHKLQHRMDDIQASSTHVLDITNREAPKATRSGSDRSNRSKSRRREDRNSSRRNGKTSSRNKRHTNPITSESDSTDRRSHSDSESSSSSGTETKRKSRTLAELNPSNSRFKKVLSYKTYLLRNSNQRETIKVFKRVSGFTKRMGVIMKIKFDGTDPIIVHKFLAKFKETADSNGISEGAAGLILPNLLSGKASIAYTASQHADAVHEDSGDIRSYADAIQWMLRTYAKDRYIQEAVNKIGDTRQKTGESEIEYGDRLALAYSRFVGVYPQAEQINLYIENLSPTVSYDVILERQKNPKDFLQLQTVIELADSFGQAIHARQGPSRPVIRRVLHAEVGSSSSSLTTTSGSYHMNGDEAVLALDGGSAYSPQPPTTPSYTGYTTDQHLPSDSYHSVPTDSQENPMQTAAALPVVNNFNPRLQSYAQPYRPGWKQSIPPRAPANSGTSPLRLS